LKIVVAPIFSERMGGYEFGNNITSGARGEARPVFCGVIQKAQACIAEFSGPAWPTVRLKTQETIN